MNINTEHAYMIFRNDFNGYSYYKIGVSKKSQTGEWINGYIRCQFKIGISLENKTKIYIKKGWLSFYLNNKETIPYIFISKFETVDSFIDFGEEVVISDNDLPF